LGFPGLHLPVELRLCVLKDSPHNADMTELSAVALDVLRTLDKKGAYQIPETPDMQPLWEVRYIMGDKSKANITIPPSDPLTTGLLHAPARARC